MQSIGLKTLSIVTTVVMYIVLQMGALVTNTGSADGCGSSWPLCHGTFMPDWDYEAIIEFSHRAVSGLAGLLTLVLAIWVWRAFPKRPLFRWLAIGGLALVTFQGLLGAAAVIWPQPKAVLALHFGISLLCFSAVLLVTALLVRSEDRWAAPPVNPHFTRWVWTLTLVTYLITYLGAYVRHMGASLACFGWPLCNGELIPTLYGPTGANFAHRVGAALVIIMTLRLVILARRHAADRPDLVKAANLAMLLVLVQAAGGAVMAVGYFNLLTQMLHSATIALYWGALSHLLLAATPLSASLPSKMGSVDLT
jgi:cytochrome c oxidase assembly protein subunit 15